MPTNLAANLYPWLNQMGIYLDGSDYWPANKKGLRYYDSKQQRSTCLRTIKKYQNRRLYDTQSSTYITLEHIRAMIKNGEQFAVIDAKNASDVTHHVLLQIIGERETQPGTSMLSNDLLANLIRFYGDSLQGVMGEYLETSVSKFVEKQDQMREQLHTILDTSAAPPKDKQNTVQASD